MENKDKVIICKDCGKEFVFTAGEQEFFASKDFSDPVRCKSCKEAKRQAMENKA
jgi:DNA replicative helicase MCM subunit Mcm2 (Cdc46/Mcm family)